MADITKDPTAQPAASNATPAATGGQQQAERTFTQAEVNQIVADRLARERKSTPNSAAEPTPEEVRAKELDAREAALSCREYIAGKKYPEKLLEVFPTSDAKAFEASVEKLLEAFPQIIRTQSTGTTATFATGGEHGQGLSASSDLDNLIDSAFSKRGLF